MATVKHMGQECRLERQKLETSERRRCLCAMAFEPCREGVGLIVAKITYGLLKMRNAPLQSVFRDGH
jgi:hypothetical protein